MAAKRKFYIAIIVLATLCCVVYGQGPGIQEIYSTCQKKSNATNEELADFQKRQNIPTTDHGKCLLACIFEETGVLTKDGKYNAQGVFEIAKMSYLKAPEKLEKAKKLIDTCSKEVAKIEERCEIAVKIANCTMVASIKYGLVEA